MSFVISFREEDAFPLARTGFVNMCGFKEKHKKMFESGMTIRELGIGKINIRALLSEFEPDVIGEGGIEINDIRLNCDSFFMLEKEKVRKVIVYVLSVDECGCESEKILDRLYADFWGTAYVDAAYELLRNEIDSLYIKKAGVGLVLSDAFGPGYYGMPTEELRAIFQIMDGDKIGVKYMPGGHMMPIKSCAGLIFVMDEGAKVPEKCCHSCVGNQSGCRYCNVLQTAGKA